MLSNSSKYAINAVLYLAINSSVDRKKGVKEISEALRIPTAFLAKLLQILAKKKPYVQLKVLGEAFISLQKTSKLLWLI